MKNLIALLIGVACLFSCEKHKEKKRWKSYLGIYESVSGYHPIKDSVLFNKIDVTDAGISLVGGQKTINMNVYTRELNDDARFDYKCEYHNLTAYTMGGGGLTNETWTAEEFAQGRLFYIKFEGNTLEFVIKTGNDLQTFAFLKQ